uniref:Wnt inhibitory factor 1 n=1 Tax=Geospiza parvula TaxID=87175 RepID=A0A8C3MNJ5_GEOPR
MAPAGRLCCAALLCGALSLCSLRAAPRQPDTLYLWIDAQQARVLIGFEEDILIVSEGKMAPFTHDFRKAQQRMPAIPVGIHSMNFTWQATGRAEYYYEFLSLHSLDKGIMADPTINIPLLGTVPHKASVVQIGFPCLGKQDGVAAFEVNVIIMNSEGNIILQTPQNAIFFKTCQQAECPGGCRNGGVCNKRHVCECPDGFYGPHCEKALCVPRCMNGGLCITPGLCICPPGFYGINCDKANCTTTCFNGGTCFYLGKCICPSGYEGDQCEISKCHQPCRNGGKCTGKNKCKCSKGYQGDLCSKREYQSRSLSPCGNIMLTVQYLFYLMSLLIVCCQIQVILLSGCTSCTRLREIMKPETFFNRSVLTVLLSSVLLSFYKSSVSAQQWQFSSREMLNKMSILCHVNIHSEWGAGDYSPSLAGSDGCSALLYNPILLPGAEPDLASKEWVWTVSGL